MYSSLLLTVLLAQISSVSAQLPPSVGIVPLKYVVSTTDTNESCDSLSILPLEDRLSYFTKSHFLQKGGGLSMIVGPQCSYLGEVQVLARINDPKLTLTQEDEMLYYIPTIRVLFVSHLRKDVIAYIMKHEGDTEPLEYFLKKRQKAESAAEHARDYARLLATAQTVSSRSSSSSEKSSSLRSIPILEPVRRPVRQSSASAIALAAAPQQTNSSTQSSAIFSEPETARPDPNSEELPSISAHQIQTTRNDLSIPQIIVGICVIGLIIYILRRRRLEKLIERV